MKVLILYLIISFTSNLYAQSKGSLTDWEFAERVDLKRAYTDTLQTLARTKLADYGLFDVYHLEIDNEGNIVFYDTENYKLIYLPKGEFEDLKLIGYGEGRGPGEFGNPFDLKFDNDGNIWIADVERMEIQQWSHEGDFLKSFQIDKYARPAKIAVTNLGNIYILSEQYTPEGIIYKYSSNGEKINSFQKPDVSEYRSVLYFEGDLQVLGEDLIISGRVKPYLRRYSSAGELIYSKGIVGFKNNENILVPNKRWISRNKELIRATIDLDVSGNIIYAAISSNIDRWIRIVDLYYASGEYKSSILLKNPARNIAVLKNKIYTLEYNYKDKEIYLGEYIIKKK